MPSASRKTESKGISKGIEHGLPGDKPRNKTYKDIKQRLSTWFTKLYY